MHELTVSERIRAKFDALTRAERQLANTMLENYPMSGLGNIVDLADNAGVSSPTVARMARKLEFGGFPEMQRSLRNELEAKISNPISKHDRWAAHAPDAHILNRFADVVMENLRHTLQHIDAGTFDAVTDLLSDGDRTIHALGGRITRSLADYFITHLQVIRQDCILLPPNSNTWPHHVLNMREGDVFVVFDVRRYEHDMLRVSQMAHDKGARIVLFTDQWVSPISSIAEHSFHCRIEAPSGWDSSVVTVFFVEALIAAVETKNWDSTRERMKTLEELFDDMKLFRKFT
ncbi:MAG: MurR/RpiR family transcriptional regulator [Hyphomicrobiales bacterium]